MKISFKFAAKFLILSLLASGCASQPPEVKPPAPALIRTLQCPAQNFVSSGITRAKPRNAEELVRYAVTPPVQTATNEWNINAFATADQNLYLSCYYRNRKVLVFTLPLQSEFCMAKDAHQKIYVECVKK